MGPRSIQTLIRQLWTDLYDIADFYEDEMLKKINTVMQYESGKTPSLLSKELNIPLSTIYRWIKTHRPTQVDDEIITPHKYEKQKGISKN